MRLPLLALGLIALTACPAAIPDSLPDWSDGYEDGSGTTDTDDTEDTAVLPGGIMAFRRLDPPGITTRLSVPGAPEEDARCEITTTGDMSGYSEIDCLLDEAELDLHFHGMRYSLYVGRGACEYVAWYDYMYQAWPIGTGPATLSFDVDDLGVVSNEVGTVGGVPTCEYDFSALDGPNCCLGEYTLTARNTTTGEVTISPGEWGGQASSCYGGAAFLEPGASFSSDGWPLGTIVFTNGDQFVKDFVFPGLSGTHASNIPYANYFDPADHGGGVPAGLNPVDRDIDGDGNIDLGAHFSTKANTVVCLDHAEEVLGSMTISMREWNEYSEFSAVDVLGNPDTTGTEPTTGGPIDDINDWQTGTPGANSFIMFGE